LQNTNILIVDDNINLAKTMTFILKRKGYAITTAKDGLEAIVKVKEKHFDIIFMDIKMPIMNGVETYKEIKKIDTQVVVIMMTAYSVDELIQDALEEGAYGILYKPLDIEKTLSIIDDLNEKEHGGFILLVDDDLGFCITLKNILAKKRYLVGIAHTGEESIIMVQEKPYDIILIDIKLPTINGLETYLRIKKIDPRVVVIIITGYRQETSALVTEAIQKNAYTCLYKPLDVEILLELIDKIIKLKKKESSKNS